MYITLYFIVTRLPDSLRAVRDHFLALDSTALTIDLLEQHLLAAETSVVAVGTARGTPRTPFFEGCSPSPLTPSYASATTVDVLGAEDVGAAFASGKRRSNKGKGGRSGGGGGGGGGGGSSGGGGGSGGGGSGGSGCGSGGFGGGSGGSGGGGGSGCSGNGSGRALAVPRGGFGGGQRQQQQRRSETPSPQQLCEWFSWCGASGGSGSCPYVIRTDFGDEAERPRWAELLRSRVAIFDLDYDAILAAMYALSVSAEGDCYLCVPPDPGIEGATLGASESALPGTAPVEALHTFTLDSRASRCFFRDSTTLTPLSARVPVRLAEPSGDPVLARSSTILPCPAHPLARVASCRTRLSCGTTTLVTPPCHTFVACTPAFLSLVLPDLCLPSRPRLTRCAFLASRGGSAPLLTPPRFPQGLLPCRLSTWTFRLQLRERFRQDLPFLGLHSDRGGEFSCDLLWEFCRGEGILQSFTLPASPHQNGIAECRIGLVMEVTCTSMIHAAAPHFLWPFAVRYAAHQLNLWPCVSLPETSPTLRWMGEVGDASVFRVWGSCAFVRDTSADKLSTRAIPCVDPLPGTVPVEVAVDLGVARGAASGGAEPGGAESEGAGLGSEGAEFGGAEPRGTASSGAAGAGDFAAGDTGAEGVRATRLGGAGVAAGAGGTRGAAAGGHGGACTRGTVAAGTGSVGGVGAGGAGAGGAGAGGASSRGTGTVDIGAVGDGAGGTGAGGTRAGGAGAGDTRAVDPGAGGAGAGGAVSGGTGAGGTVRPRPFFVPLLRQSRPASPVRAVRTGRRVPRPRPPPDPGTHAMALRPSSVPLRVPLPPPSKSSLPTIPDPESDLARAASPTVSRLLATVVTDPAFESTAASALIAELLEFSASYRLDYATALLVESEPASPPSVGGECALGTDILEDRQEDFECLAAAVPHLVAMLLAPEGDPDAPDIPTTRSYAEAITGPYSS
ncbi:unnamed protein product [Closterium sp. NIES-54]